MNQLKDLPIIGQNGEGTVKAFSTSLLFDNIEGADMGKHTQAGALNFTLATTGHKILAGNRFTLVADGVSAVNFDANFDFFYGVANGEILPAGTYEVYFLYKGNGKVTVNVPAGTSGASTVLPAISEPTSFTATSVSSSQIDLSWADVANETGYELQSSTNNASWVTVATLAANAISYSDTGLTASTTYYYRLRALGNGTSTGNSAYVTANASTQAAADTTAPSYSVNYPIVNTITSDGFTIRTSLNEAGTTYFVVVADGSAAPTSVQVKAGQNSAGTAAIKSGSIAVAAATTEYTSVVTALASSTAFDVYLASQDTAGNLQAAPTKFDVTTNSAVVNMSFAAVTDMTVSGNTLTSTSTAAKAVADQTITEDGWAQATLSATLSDSESAVLGLDYESVQEGYTAFNFAFWCFGGVLYCRDAGAQHTLGGTPVGGTIIRMKRTGTTFEFQSSNDSGATFTTLRTSTCTTATFYIKAAMTAVSKTLNNIRAVLFV